ncbi:MAG TPA: metallopeptidase family protein [Candidatus Dormibacteraeota bacterium]|nr:metallopeptidase family protein [Candidatus Dormibacteraeota bacterium]
MRVSRARFEEAVKAAIDAVPEPFQSYLEEVEFVVAERSGKGLFGRYEGAGALAPGGFPARITIYQRAHEDACDSWEALVEEVRRTILHEIGHHFHMAEEELPY